MAIGKNKIRIAISLDKNALRLIDEIAKASPYPLTRSEVIQFAVADFYLSILESNEKTKGENN